MAHTMITLQMKLKIFHYSKNKEHTFPKKTYTAFIQIQCNLSQLYVSTELTSKSQLIHSCGSLHVLNIRKNIPLNIFIFIRIRRVTKTPI